MINKIIFEDMEKISENHANILMKLKNKSLLLIGSTGTILSYMAEFLCALNKKHDLNLQIYLHGRNINKLKIRHKNILENENVFLLEFDLLKDFPINKKFDYIIHGASPAATKYFMEMPVDTILANVIGMNNVLKYISKFGGKALFLSSNAIYGKSDKKIITEDTYGLVDPLGNRSCYVEAKRLTEQLCAAYVKQYKVNACIARVPFTYAPNYNLVEDTRALPRFIKKIINNENIEMFKDDAKIQYTYVGDVINGFIYILLKGMNLPEGVYNVCSSDCMKMENMVKIMLDIVESKSKLIVKNEDYYFKNNKEIDFTFVDNKKLKSLGWKEEFDFFSGLTQTVLSMQAIYGTR